MPYPMTAPIIEQTLQIKANRYAFKREPNANGINSTSGGIGKKEASAIDSTPNALGPLGFSDQDKTQS